MTKIKQFVESIDEELKDAKDYAEKYVEYKAFNNPNWATKYKEMALDELKHATYIHDKAVETIEELQKIYTPPVAMQEKWDKSHAEYVERVALIRQMLAL